MPWGGRGKVIQPVDTSQVEAFFQNTAVPENVSLGAQAIRDVVTNLKTMGLVETDRVTRTRRTG